MRTWGSPVFCLESAAALTGLPIFGEPRHIHLLSDDAKTWCVGDVIVHGARDGRAVTRTDGVDVTSETETAVDLARVLPAAFALAVVDATLRRLGPEEVLDVSAHGRAQQNRRGLLQLDWVQERATADAESVGESVSRAVIEWLGYERPELQVEFANEGAIDRVDFFFRAARVLGESDGYGKYDAKDPQAMKQHFMREKIREDRLRRHEGPMARWDWADTMRAQPVDAKLRAAGLHPIRPPATGMLATLASNPRSLPPRPTRAISSKRASQ
ncbi:hypothetical protein GCM10009775_27890 [Microbacterium aoyamense]|uniref:Uncharacterized protein n=1 Tax=Microbacterium aoyamense TaxID=344166 RepID=A0ABP5B723_9MICO|nr:hypothetical protein [Microbacterium aoyamense]